MFLCTRHPIRRARHCLVHLGHLGHWGHLFFCFPWFNFDPSLNGIQFRFDLTPCVKESFSVSRDFEKETRLSSFIAQAPVLSGLIDVYLYLRRVGWNHTCIPYHTSTR